ncbi:MAG: threonine--tRNA ligase [Chlamydia sp.]
MKIFFQCNSAPQEKIELQEGSTAHDLALQLKQTAPHQAVACSINGQMKDLRTPLQEDDLVILFDFDSQEGKEVFWHSSAHILAQAILRLFPEAKPTIGPPIDQGFYYDFANLTISDTDFEKIESEMEKIVQENHIPKRYAFETTNSALERFEDNKYKQEIIQEYAGKGDVLTGYAQGEFFDLCRGPHISNLGKIKSIKLMKTSGAYWRGDAKNEMLVRIYGTSFPERKLLKEYLFALEEAKKRDHKILGPKLDLFSLREEAPGIPFIHPKGMVIWNRILAYWREVHNQYKYVEIKTPSMMARTLWEKSGHWENYRENMFTSSIEEREFAIKPMNCPGAMLHYGSKIHSYRELPMKLAEIGHVHRYEPSGSLSGLFRVRSFHQDDAHIFMSLDQIQEVISETLNLLDQIYSTFGLKYELALSTKPKENTIGSDEYWQIATDSLKKALDMRGAPYIINHGDGAFYGPKIDIRLFDALGRSWQCGTIQLDMALPERFELEYTASDGTKMRPVIAHRALLGSIERFLGSLIEFYAGKFPFWLSPRQVAIIPVADRHIERAQEIEAIMRNCEFETEVYSAHESVSKKVREAQILQFNYILTIGDQEIENQTISVRTRDNVLHGAIEIDSLVSILQEEAKTKARESRISQLNSKN